MDNSIYMFEKEKTGSSSKKFIPIPKGPHNENMVKNAEGNAKYKRKHPSELEKKMMEMLDNQGIRYEFQKIIYVKSSGGFIKQYFIVDFYIPQRDVIIELHGASSENTIKCASEKKATIKRAYPLYTVIDWFSMDFSIYIKQKRLINLIRGK